MRTLFTAILLLTLCVSSHAELPPSAYDNMQADAPEHLDIEVIQVEVTEDEETGQKSVSAIARVEKVHRTATQITPDDIIRIAYSIEERPEGWAGPGEVPVLQENERTVAYLARASETDPYSPAAGRMSFLNF